MTVSEVLQDISLTELKEVRSTFNMLYNMLREVSVTDIACMERILADEIMKREHNEPTPGAEKEV